MSIADFIRKLPSAVRSEDASAESCTIQFDVSTPMYLVLEKGVCTVHEGKASTPDLTMQSSDEDFVDLFTGKLEGISAYMSGKLSLDGDLMLAQRIGAMFDPAKLS
jgi:putative sterol carrier protein